MLILWWAKGWDSYMAQLAGSLYQAILLVTPLSAWSGGTNNLKCLPPKKQEKSATIGPENLPLKPASKKRTLWLMQETQWLFLLWLTLVHTGINLSRNNCSAVMNPHRLKLQRHLIQFCSALRTSFKCHTVLLTFSFWVQGVNNDLQNPKMS